MFLLLQFQVKLLYYIFIIIIIYYVFIKCADTQCPC